MSIAEEIEKLQALHVQGALTDDEFAQAKAKLLAHSSDEQSTSNSDTLSDEVEYLRLEQDLTRLDRDWDRERERYMVQGRYGSRYLPSEGGSVFMGILIVCFGIFWTISAASMGAPVFFPIFGVIFIIFGAVTSFTSFSKAGAYKEAERHYQERRQQLLARRNRSQ